MRFSLSCFGRSFLGLSYSRSCSARRVLFAVRAARKAFPEGRIEYRTLLGWGVSPYWAFMVGDMTLLMWEGV